MLLALTTAEAAIVSATPATGPCWDRNGSKSGLGEIAVGISPAPIDAEGVLCA